MSRKTPATAPAALPSGPAGSRRELWEILTTRYPADKEAGGRAVAEPAPARMHGALEPGTLQFSARMAHWIARHGVPAQALEPLQAMLDLGKTELAPLLGMDRATVRRYLVTNAGEAPVMLPTHTSETVLRLAELDALANGTFQSSEGARKWLKTPHPLLDGETPLQAAGTSYGGQRVREILTAIQHGGVA